MKNKTKFIAVLVLILVSSLLVACGNNEVEPTATIAPTSTLAPTATPTDVPTPTPYPNPVDWDLAALGEDDWDATPVQWIEPTDWQANYVLSNLAEYWNAYLHVPDHFPDCAKAISLISHVNPDLPGFIVDECAEMVETGRYFSAPSMDQLEIRFAYDAEDRGLIIRLDTRAPWMQAQYYTADSAFHSAEEVKQTQWSFYMLLNEETSIWEVALLQIENID